MNTVVALFVSLVLLPFGLGARDTEGSRPCCWRDGMQLVSVGCTEPCCDISAPPAAGEPTGGSSTKSPFSAAPSFAAPRPDPVPSEAAVVLPWSAPRSLPLYALECVLRL